MDCKRLRVSQELDMVDTEKQREPQTSATIQKMGTTDTENRPEQLIAAPPLFLTEGCFSPPRVKRHGLPDSY